jgi:hypothetical protein
VEESGLKTLSSIFAEASTEKLSAAKQALCKMDREELINRFRTCFAKGSRLSAFLISEELTKRGIPPCFRHNNLAPDRAHSVNENFDLLTYDVRWIAHKYPEHASVLRGVRAVGIFSGLAVHSTVSHLYHLGNSPAWLIVKKIKMSPAMQVESYWLRSAPMMRKVKGIIKRRDKVFSALAQRRASIMKTGIDNEMANRILVRRVRLWVCAEMAEWSPSRTADLYERMTGDPIKRNVAAKQLEKIKLSIDD